MILAASSSAALFASGVAYANPHNGTVVAGRASINSSNPDHLLIDQTSSNAIINWQSFSISANQSVQFVQPSKTSATLNRVTGGSQSFIDGLLSANGQVLILNPEGVLFGRNARINVGGLLATTSDIANDDFMKGKLAFHATGVPGASVVNEGSIHVSDAGLAALVAPTVANSGVIEAHLGRIELASGETYTLDLYGDHLINFEIGQTASTPTRRVNQSGKLIADGGEVFIGSDAAAALVSNVVNVAGIVQAQSISTTRSGEILLEAPSANISVTGKLDATGQPGVSGGGINVKGASVQVGASGTLDASASDQGNGGNIKLWGTNTLAVAGSVSAHGGSQGGNGGSLDLSTSGGLSVMGSVDLQAPEGTAGSLLLDPASITVAAIGSSDPTASTVGAGFLNFQLQSGTNVSLTATNSITVDAAIDGRPVGGGASSHPSGSVTLTAGSLTIAAPIVTDRGAITLNATGTAAAGSGDITFTGSNLSSSTPNSGFLWVADCSAGCASGTESIGSAAITLNAENAISFDTTVDTNGQLAGIGAVKVTAGGSVTLPSLNGIKTTSTGVSGIGSLTIAAGGLVSLQGANANGSINITGGGIMTGGSPLYSSIGGIALNGGSVGITVGSAQNNTIGVQAGGGGNVAFVTTGGVKMASSIVASGNLCIGGAVLATCGGGASGTTAGAGDIAAGSGAILQAGSPTGDKGIDLESSGMVSVSTLVVGSTGSVILNAAQTISVANPISGYLGTDSIGNLQVAAGGNVTLDGANVGLAPGPPTGTATASITSTGGDVIVGGSPVVARDGIIIAAGSTVQVNGVSGSGPTLAAGTAADGSGTVTNSGATISIIGSTTTSSGASKTNTPDIILNGGVLGEGGLTIGSPTAPVGKVSALGALQAGDPTTSKAANLSVYSNDSVNLGLTVVGPEGTLLVDTQAALNSAGTVTFNSEVAGFQQVSGAEGVGALTVSSAGSVQLGSVRANGGVAISVSDPSANIIVGNHLTSAGNVSLYLNGGCLAIATNCSAVPSISFAEQSAGESLPIGISASGIVISKASDVYAPGALSATLISVDGNDIVPQGSGTFAIGGLYSPDAQGSNAPGFYITGPTTGLVQLGALTSDSFVQVIGDTVQVGALAGVRNSTSSPSGPKSGVFISGTNEVDVFGPMVATGQITLSSAGTINIEAPLLSLVTSNGAVGPSANVAIAIGNGGNTTNINLSNNVFSDGGDIQFNGNVVLFEGVTRTVSDPLLLAYSNLLANSDVIGNSSNLQNVDANNITDVYDLVVPTNTENLANSSAIAVSTSHPVTNNGATVACGYLACPTASGASLTMHFNGIPPDVTGGDQTLLNYVFNPLTVIVSTHGVGNPDPTTCSPSCSSGNYFGGTVTFEGMVNRTVPGGVGNLSSWISGLSAWNSNNASVLSPTKVFGVTGVSSSDQSTKCGFGVNMCEMPVPFSYVNTALVLGAQIVDFKGQVGDTQAEAGLAVPTQPAVVGVPLLGSFMVDTLGVTSSSSSPTPTPPYGVECQSNCVLAMLGTSGLNTSQTTMGYLDNPSYQANSGPAQQNQELYNWTYVYTSSLDAIDTSAPNEQVYYYKEDNTQPGNQDIGLAGYVSNGNALTYASGITLTTSGDVGLGAAAAMAAVGSGSPGGVSFSAFGSLDVSDVGGQDVNSSASDVSRRSNGPAVESAVGEVIAENQCPRGAGGTADLGQSSGEAGASPDVFARCGSHRFALGKAF